MKKLVIVFSISPADRRAGRLVWVGLLSFSDAMIHRQTVHVKPEIHDFWRFSEMHNLTAAVLCNLYWLTVDGSGAILDAVRTAPGRLAARFKCI
jgi:hypothetical protein